MPALTKYDAYVSEDQSLNSHIVFKIDIKLIMSIYEVSETKARTLIMNDIANLLNLKGNLYFEQIVDYLIEDTDYFFLIEYQESLPFSEDIANMP